MADMSRRIEYVDWVKGAAILLVVLGHALQSCNLAEEFWLFRWIYSFHMPLFMFVSGFVCWRASQWGVCRRRALQLLVPFFTSIVLGEVLFNWSGLGMRSLCEKIVAVTLQPDRGLWFLWVLFFINVIFIACRKLARACASVVGAGEWSEAMEFLTIFGVGAALNGVEIVTGTKLLGFHWIAWYFVYFALGVYLRIWMERGMTENAEKWLRMGCTVAFVAMVPFFRMHNEGPSFFEYVNLGPLGAVGYRFVIGAVGSVMVLMWFKYISRYDVSLKGLTELGGVTLGVYYFHFLVIHAVEENVRMLPVWGQVAVIGISALAVSWIAVELCKRTAVTRVLCLGMPWRDERRVARAAEPSA